MMLNVTFGQMSLTIDESWKAIHDTCIFDSLILQDVQDGDLQDSYTRISGRPPVFR